MTRTLTRAKPADDPLVEHDPPALYHLGSDPSERFDVAAEHPEVLAEIALEVERHRSSLTPVESHLDALISAGE